MRPLARFLLRVALVLSAPAVIGAALWLAARYQPLRVAPPVSEPPPGQRSRGGPVRRLLAAVVPARDPALAFVTRGTATPPLANTTNVLLVGLDTRPSGWGGRADALVVAVLDDRSRHVGLISVPRDLLVGVPQSDDPMAPRALGRINVVYRAGFKQGGRARGVELLKRVVRQTLGLPIAHVVFVAHAGFEELVDAVGGVTVNVRCPIKDRFIDARAPGGRVDFDVAAGIQQLDGKRALMFARARHGRGIFDRARRQQALLLGLRDRLLELGLARLRGLLPALRRAVYSDLDLLAVARLYRRLARVRREHIHGLVLGAREAKPLVLPDGRWVMVPQPQAIAARLATLFRQKAPGTRRWRCPPADAGLRWRRRRAKDGGRGRPSPLP